ncbi:MAG TPA: GTP pyrophosphokinase family protein [Candidatus Coproplasma stercorigallinarum]|nr:GTP pyrophosphokinase family protein [Candidatus Coproplasma stercorigallinarum]
MEESVGESGELSAGVEERLVAALSEGSMARMMGTLEKLKRLMSYYRCAIMEIETKFRVLDEQFSLRHERNPIDTIKSRLKSPESILEKLNRRGYPKTLSSVESNLTDIAGVRVICSFKDDIYMLADCLLKQDDVKLIAAKDYIKNPKPNGYRSLHLIVETPIYLQDGKRQMKAEVQLRTIAMEFWANLEHKLRYKKNLPPELAAATAKRLYDCAERSALLDDEMQRVRAAIEGV